MLVFYGLGNNDQKYLATKHNVGRIVIEELARILNSKFQQKDTFYFSKANLAGQDIFLVYSAGFMNESGLPLLKFINYFKLNFDNSSKLVVLQDDSDQLENNIKLVQGGGSGGHHGINSIYKHIPNTNLTANQIWRLKIGIRPQSNTKKSETFVLSKLSSIEERSNLHLAKKISEMFLLFDTNMEKAQSILNTKP